MNHLGIMSLEEYTGLMVQLSPIVPKVNESVKGVVRI